MNTTTKELHTTLQRFTIKDSVVILAKSNIDPDDKFIIHAQMANIDEVKARVITKTLTRALEDALKELVN
jgi:hypothetical protein